jgi:hypothetical protein
MYECHFFMFHFLHIIHMCWANYRLRSWVQLLYTVSTYGDCKKSEGLFLALGSGKSLCCLLPCLWLYRIPTLDITLARHMILPSPYAWLCRVWKYMGFMSWWPCLALVISFRGQETNHLLYGRETNWSTQVVQRRLPDRKQQLFRGLNTFK